MSHGSAVCAELADVYAAVALDVAEPEEVARAEAHAGGCRRCRAILAECRETVALLGASVTQVSPPERLRERVLLAAQRTPQEAAPRPRSVWGLGGRRWSPAWAVAAASLVVSIVSLVWAASLNAQMAELRTAAAQDRERAARYDRIVEVLKSPQLSIHALTPAAQSAQSSGTAYLDPRSGLGMIAASGLPPIQPGHALQIWLVRGNERISVGMLRPDGAGGGYTVIRLPQDLQTWDFMGLTEEPDQGSPAPTSPRIMGATLRDGQ
ncbi:MAG: anti-sigma factor [Chloroflexota bacterium]|nr:anti-sigma factor [Chloroflexota bacterium]